MSLNSNSTHLLCNELSQTQQKNELTHELVCFFRLPISQIVNQSKRLLRLPKILQTGQSADNHCSVFHKNISYSVNQLLSHSTKFTQKIWNLFCFQSVFIPHDSLGLCSLLATAIRPIKTCISDSLLLFSRPWSSLWYGFHLWSVRPLSSVRRLYRYSVEDVGCIVAKR